MRRSFLAVISLVIIISMMSFNVCAASPSSGDLIRHNDNTSESQSNDNTSGSQSNDQNYGIQAYADVDDDTSTISEEIIAADIDDELPSVSGDMYIAPDTGDTTNIYLYIIIASLAGAIVFTYRKIKKA